MPGDAFSGDVELAVNALRALADPVRLRIVHLLLGEPELCVCQMTAVLGINYAALSKHLQLLKLVGIVGDEKRGRWVYYHLNRESWNPAVERLVACVQDLAGQDPAPFSQDRKDAHRVTCCDLEAVAKLGPAFLRRGTGMAASKSAGESAAPGTAHTPAKKSVKNCT